MSAEPHEPLPAIRLTHYATATVLEALEREREAQWAAQQGAEEKAKDAARWAGSPEGQHALSRAMQAATAVTDHLREARRVDWRTLHEPVGPIHGDTWEEEQAWAERRHVEADEAAYEASVQHRLSDLRHEGTWWTYGHVDPLHADDERQGWGCWLECAIGRESDTGVWLSEPDWHSWEGAADEAAARTEATRRNWGEG